MSWLSGFVVYFMIWWIVLFAVLPWGNKASDNVQKGNVASAPDKPNLAKKFIATSFISLIFWGLVYVLVHMQIIDFRGIAVQIESGERTL